MTNPVTVEVTRGSLVESRHRGAVVAVDGDGKVVFSVGDIDAPTFPRSGLQGDAGAAADGKRRGGCLWLRRQGTGARLLLAQVGEDEHVALAAAMLARAGRGVETLECGAHWSSSQRTVIHQARTMDKPTALHNNCSGKHAGLRLRLLPSGVDPKGYVGYDHPLQAEIRGVMESLTGAVLGHDNCGTDGCSIPTYAVPLRGLAHGFAKMATGTGLEPLRAKASRTAVRGLHGRTLLCGRNRPRLHRADGGSTRPHLRQNRRRGCLLRSHSRAGNCDRRSNATTAIRVPPRRWLPPTLSRFFDKARPAPRKPGRHGYYRDAQLERYSRRRHSRDGCADA